MAFSDNNELLQNAREKLYRLKSLRQFEGTNYLWFDHGTEPDFEQMFSRIRQIDFQRDDVICVGFPRSGNHWVFEILHMALNQTLEYSPEIMFSHSFESLSANMKPRVPGEGQPRLFTGHLTLDKLSLPGNFQELGVKVLYILRNPKDAIVSSYGLMSQYKEERVRLDMTWPEYLELQLTGEVPWGGWFETISTTEDFVKQNPSCPFHVVQYEKLREDPVREIRNLCMFLNKPEALVEQIAEVTQLSKMKDGTKGKLSQIESIFWRDDWHFIGQGKVQGWKETFTVEQSERFDKIFEERCRSNDLAAGVKEYI